jgi:hypothetical protein
MDFFPSHSVEQIPNMMLELQRFQKKIKLQTHILKKTNKQLYNAPKPRKKNPAPIQTHKHHQA